MKKRLNIYLSLLLIVIVSLTVFIIKGNSEKIEFSEMVFSDISHENSNISIKYPQIKDKNQIRTNEMIKNFVENMPLKTYGSDYINLKLNASYKISYNENNLLSIIFYVNGNVSTAAYPNNFLLAINIDLKTESVIKFSDIYTVEDDIIEVIKRNFKDQFIPKKLNEWGIKSNNESYENYISKLSSIRPYNVKNALSDEKKFYFSDDEVIICLEMPHAIGDYFEVEVKYKELRKFVKTNVEPFV